MIWRVVWPLLTLWSRATNDPVIAALLAGGLAPVQPNVAVRTPIQPSVPQIPPPQNRG